METIVPYTHELESKSWTSGGKLQVKLDIPEECRVTHILVQQEHTVQNTHSSDVNVYDFHLDQVLQNILLDAPLLHIRSTGRALRELYAMMRGKYLTVPGAQVVSASSSATVRSFCVIPFSDPRAYRPHDTAAKSKLLRKTQLEIVLAAQGDFLTSTTATQQVTAGNFYFTAFCIPDNGEALPAELAIDYEDWSQSTAHIKGAGALSHLFAYDETDRSLNISTEYTRLKATTDGAKFIDNTRSEQLVADYNDKMSLGIDAITAGIDAGALGEQLGKTTVPFVPIFTPANGYKLSELPHANDAVRVDLTGSASSTRFVYRQIKATDQASEHEAMRVLGVQAPERTPVEAKTASKVAVDGGQNVKRAQRLRRTLPKRFGASVGRE
jgi:hypothetical protein